MKQAIIVTFEVRTRIVVDVPDGKTVGQIAWEEPVNRESVFEKLTEAAKEKIITNGIENYLLPENMDWETDMEMEVCDNETPNVIL